MHVCCIHAHVCIHPCRIVVTTTLNQHSHQCTQTSLHPHSQHPLPSHTQATPSHYLSTHPSTRHIPAQAPPLDLFPHSPTPHTRARKHTHTQPSTQIDSSGGLTFRHVPLTLSTLHTLSHSLPPPFNRTHIPEQARPADIFSYPSALACTPADTHTHARTRTHTHTRTRTRTHTRTPLNTHTYLRRLDPETYSVNPQRFALSHSRTHILSQHTLTQPTPPHTPLHTYLSSLNSQTCSHTSEHFTHTHTRAIA